MNRPTTSITRRLTTAFAVVMAAVLIVGGIGIYLGERFALDRNLTRDLARQSRELTTLVHRPGAFDSTILADRPDSYVQILTPNGNLIAATPPLLNQRMLTRQQLSVAQHGSHTFSRGSLTRLTAHTYRVQTTRVSDAGRPLIALTAVRRDSRDEALRELIGQLLVYGAAALAVAILVGYKLTRAAMEPVENLRRQADNLYNTDSTEPRSPIEVRHAGDEIERLAVTLSKLLERVDETVQRERTFAAAAGHELRTPLTALTAEIDLALRGTRSADELTDALRAARIDAQRLTTLTEDLLLFSRIASGELERTEYQISDACTYAVEQARIPADRSFEFFDHSAGEIVVGNEQMMQRAIGNLLDNAIKHGSGRITLVTQSDDLHRYAQISVADEGPGVSPGFLPQALDPFARDVHTRSGTGTGLGLALVHEIARAHGGSVTLENLARGMQVTITIPVADNPQAR